VPLEKWKGRRQARLPFPGDAQIVELAASGGVGATEQLQEPARRRREQEAAVPVTVAGQGQGRHGWWCLRRAGAGGGGGRSSPAVPGAPAERAKACG